MTERMNSLSHHRDHLALVEDIIASKEVAIARQQRNIRQLLLEGRNVVAETNAMRVNAATLRRLQSERLATLNVINKYTSQ